MIDRAASGGSGVINRIPAPARTWARRSVVLLVLGVVVTVLVRQLWGLDWPVVLRSLPATPWFYLAFAARYLLLPVTETLCYSAVWNRNLAGSFGAFLIKRLMNASVVSASGDAYFLTWSADKLGLGYRKAFSGIKDVTLLSAAAANGVAVAVLGAYLAWGDWRVFDAVEPRVVGLVLAVTLAAALLSVVVIAFRGRVLAVPAHTMWRVIVYHAVRSGGALVLLGLQWSAAMPEVGFATWANLLIIALLVARTPLLPAPELLFLSIALALVGSIDAPQARLEAMFLADAALVQLLAIPSLALGTLLQRKSELPASTA